MHTPAPTSPANPTVTFWGAAQSVTGSMHLVEHPQGRLLLDCGRAHGPHRLAPLPSFPFDPERLDAVVLSHAHLDHAGLLPHLVRQGFTGPVFCTPATRDVIALMLADSARHHEHDDHVRRILGRADEPPLGFTRADVDQLVRQCATVPVGPPGGLGPEQTVAPGVVLRFASAGHLLGSAMAQLTLNAGGRTARLTYTGDLGRPGLPLLRDPDPVPEADLVICESTYGNRRHEPLHRVVQGLVEVVKRTLERGGKVLVPAFTLGRTQMVAWVLRRAMRAGQLPDTPVWIDSPLAAQVAAVFRRYPDELDADSAARLVRGEDPVDDGVRYAQTLEESHVLAETRGPGIIVAAGAMCDSGRIVRHLKHNLDDPRTSIVLVSYQAPDSLGRRLLEPRPTVRFHGRVWNLWADVVDLGGFSGHADREGLLTLLGPLAGRTQRVALVHGETEQAEALGDALRDRGFREVVVPRPGETVPVVGSHPCRDRR